MGILKRRGRDEREICRGGGGESSGKLPRDDNRQPCSSMTANVGTGPMTSRLCASHHIASHGIASHSISHEPGIAPHGCKRKGMDRVANFRLAGDEAIDNPHSNSIQYKRDNLLINRWVRQSEKKGKKVFYFGCSD